MLGLGGEALFVLMEVCRASLIVVDFCFCFCFFGCTFAVEVSGKIRRGLCDYQMIGCDDVEVNK